MQIFKIESGRVIQPAASDAPLGMTAGKAIVFEVAAPIGVSIADVIRALDQSVIFHSCPPRNDVVKFESLGVNKTVVL